MHINYKKAFTLVELIVAITILAILWTIAFISLQWYSKSSRDSVRISDVSNMKTALELFHLNSWKYPLPDDDYLVTFSWHTLRNQWKFWTNVVSSLSRNINKIPTDPLTDKKYIYSVANNKNEFEILTLLESDLALKPIDQTNAATYSFTPRINWTYNRVFIKTPSHIVPVPSIINSEVDWGNLILNTENIKSQVVSNWGNIPNHGNVNYSTGELNWLVLSVYTGSLDKDSDDSDKENAMIAIQWAYTWSSLLDTQIINEILSESSNNGLTILFNTIILKDSTIKLSKIKKSVINCWSIWEIIYWTEEWTIDWLTCYNDIIVCNWSWTWYTISACNAWSNISWTGTSSYWELYQWWNKTWLRNAWTGTTQILLTSNDSTYSNSTFIYSHTDWTSIHNNNLWWEWINTFEARKWPCQSGYHVPTSQEWINIHSVWWWWSNWLEMSNKLLLPFAWYRHYQTSDINSGEWIYWTSTPNNLTDAYNQQLWSWYTHMSSSFSRSYASSIRCFKN